MDLRIATEHLDPVPGTQSAEAFDALERGDITKAKELFEPLARTGSIRAMLALGRIHDGADKSHPNLDDDEQALYWYTQAVEKGQSVHAGRNLARMYYLGQGIEVDYEKAYSYYEWLARAKHPVALYRLGVMNELGQSVDKDIDQARYWYAKAAKAGHILSRRNIGIMAIKRKNVFLGIPLILSAIIEGLLRCVFTQSSSKLNWF